jgi:hypothetical protein
MNCEHEILLGHTQAAAGEGRRTTNSRPTDLTFKALPPVFLLKYHPFETRCLARTDKQKATIYSDFRFAGCGIDTKESA